MKLFQVFFSLISLSCGCASQVQPHFGSAEHDWSSEIKDLKMELESLVKMVVTLQNTFQSTSSKTETDQRAGRDNENRTTNISMAGGSAVAVLLVLVLLYMIRTRNRALTVCMHGIENTGSNSYEKVAIKKLAQTVGVERFLNRRVKRLFPDEVKK